MTILHRDRIMMYLHPVSGMSSEATYIVPTTHFLCCTQGYCTMNPKSLPAIFPTQSQYEENTRMRRFS